MCVLCVFSWNFASLRFRITFSATRIISGVTVLCMYSICGICVLCIWTMKWCRIIGATNNKIVHTLIHLPSLSWTTDVRWHNNCSNAILRRLNGINRLKLRRGFSMLQFEFYCRILTKTFRHKRTHTQHTLYCCLYVFHRRHRRRCHHRCVSHSICAAILVFLLYKQ